MDLEKHLRRNSLPLNDQNRRFEASIWNYVPLNKPKQVKQMLDRANNGKYVRLDF